MVYKNRSDKGVRMMKRYTGILCIILILSFSIFISFIPYVNVVSYADQEVKTVRVGYYLNEVFQEGAAEGEVKNGYAYEYYRKLSEYTGWKYEYVYGEFGDLYQQLLDGEVDLLAGLAWKEERADLIGYPDDIMGNESYYLVKHDTSTEITSDPATMNGKRIGVLDSAMVNVLKQYLKKNHVKAEVVIYKGHTELFKAFNNGKVDILAAESDGAYGRDHIEVLTSFGAADYYLCVSKSRPDLLRELNTAQTLLAAEEPNYLNSLREKYYSMSVTSRAFSSAERDWIEENDTLDVGYLENYLPYSDTDEKGQPTGVVKDVIPEIFNKLALNDIKITFTGYESYDDMISEMSSGVIDVAFPVGGGLYYSEENGIYQSNPVVSAQTELVYKGVFSEKTTAHFAANENNRMQYYYIRTNFPDAEITMYPSIDGCLQAVLSGKAGCTTLNGLRANDILKNHDYKDLSLRQNTQNDDRSFGVEIGNEGLLKILNRGINVIGSDYAQNVSYRYTGGLYSYGMLDMLRDNMALIGTLLSVIAALIIFLLVRDTRRSKKEIREKEAVRLELEEKNRELTEGRESLAIALEAAENANHAKTDFLNNMSHDIRTPMNAIVGFTQMAESHIDNKEQVKDYLGKISISSKHLLSLINDVLDMSRIESGKVKIEEDDVHLPEVIHDLRTIIQSDISAKKIDLFIDTQDIVHEDIVTDKLRLDQILLNIMSNAIKFTPGGGAINLTIIEKKSQAEGSADFQFRIKDNGIGMSEEFQKSIFDAFTREQTSTVSGIQGTGLGMAITKNIIDMMGGTIEVHSKEGEGSEFIVDIPFRISERTNESEVLQSLKGIRVLVADDDSDSCRSVCSMLEEIGMKPDWANSGEDAVARARGALDQPEPFGLYILDLMMPGMNGIETTRAIREAVGNEVPIIIFTAYDWVDVEDEAKEAGVTQFCSKPLFMSELKNVLGKVLTGTSDEPEQKADEPDDKVRFDGKHILLAEDNQMNQLIATAILEEAGFSIDIAENGEEAVEKMISAPAGTYDIILMDIQMPKMNGYEAAKQIRGLDDPDKAGIPIVAVTANAFEEDRKIAFEAGMNGHLAKPYDVPAIMKTLKELLL